MRQPVSHYQDSAYDPGPAGHDDGYEVVGEQRDEPPRRVRRLPAVLLTLAVMALFSGGLWFAYVQGARHAALPAQSGDGVPVIRADDRPTKVKPDQPGGMPIPDQNISLYNDKPGKPSVEKLLPPPEQPMPRPAPPPPPPPKEAAAPAPAAVAPPVPADAAPAPPPSTPASAPKPAAKAAEPAAASTTGSYNGKIQVRLGSVRSPDAAREEWTRLKRENADLLGSLKAVAVRTDLGEKGIYYRIEAGPFADAAAAERLCGELKRRQRGCILAR